MSTDGQNVDQDVQPKEPAPSRPSLQPRINGRFAPAEPVDEDSEDSPTPEEDDGWTPEHHAWARHFGLTDEAMKKYSPDDFLVMAQASLRGQPGATSYQPASSPPQQPSSPEQRPIFQFPEPPKLNAREDDDIPPAVADFANQVGSQLKQYQDAMQKMAEQNIQLSQQLQSFTEQEQHELLYAQFDRAADQLPEDQYGRGRVSNLSEPHAMNRHALLDAVVRAEQRMTSQGIPVPPLDVLVAHVDQQLRQSFAAPSLKRVANKSRDRASQTTSPPSSGGKDNHTPHQRAVAAATKAMRRHGMIP